MFWRLMFGISLVAILSGSLSRQAEAAGDFARTLAELGEGDRVEEVDGGVGDDPLEALKADAAGSVALVAVAPELSGLDAWLSVPPLEPGPRWTSPRVISRLSARSGRRQAWLQRFLF